MAQFESQNRVDRFILALRNEVNHTLAQVTRHPRGEERIAERAFRYSVLTPGHRWRPILFLTLIKAIKKAHKPYMATAAGLEIIHTATLIIDDLPFVDDATMRRSKPCCHVRFGIDVAVYASHLAFDLAEILILKDTPDHLKTSVFHELKILKKTLVAGQCIERALSSKTISASLRTVKNHYNMRSGALFAFSCKLAALYCDMPQSSVDAIERFGRHTGIAYQIADDLADVSGDPKQIGKATQMDAGKINLPRHYGRRFAIQQLRRNAELAVGSLKKTHTKQLAIGYNSLLTTILGNLHRHY